MQTSPPHHPGVGLARNVAMFIGICAIHVTTSIVTLLGYRTRNSRGLGDFQTRLSILMTAGIGPYAAINICAFHSSLTAEGGFNVTGAGELLVTLKPPSAVRDEWK